jgi:hypothetical protein
MIGKSVADGMCINTARIYIESILTTSINKRESIKKGD